MLPERPRVFLGTEDRGGILTALASGFRALGCPTTTMVKHPEVTEPELRYDVVRGREILRRVAYEQYGWPIRGVLRRLDLALSVALNGAATSSYLDHDVFLFVAGPWAPKRLLYPLLKRLGKKIIAYYLGSDVRHPSALLQEYGVDSTSWGPGFRLDPLEPKLRGIRWDELYADAIYSVPEQSGLLIRPYYHAHLPVLLPPDHHVPDRAVPKILHAPSRPKIKGTAFVLEALERLRAEGLRFEFRLLTDVPREQVIGVLQDTDIVIDELFLRGPGILCAEGMAAGCAVATRILEPPMPFFDAPLCPISPGTLVAQVRRLINDVPYRVDLAARGRAWALEEFHPPRIARHILRQLGADVAPEYVPTFYLERFIPPTRLSRSTRHLSLRVAEQFHPETRSLLQEAARRGVIAGPGFRAGPPRSTRRSRSPA